MLLELALVVAVPVGTALVCLPDFFLFCVFKKGVK